MEGKYSSPSPRSKTRKILHSSPPSLTNSSSVLLFFQRLALLRYQRNPKRGKKLKSSSKPLKSGGALVVWLKEVALKGTGSGKSFQDSGKKVETRCPTVLAHASTFLGDRSSGVTSPLISSAFRAVGMKAPPPIIRSHTLC